MKVNYVLMYGIPYVRYKEFETFEDISKFLVHKGYVNYSIFKKLEDKEEIEMIYRDNDIHYLENFVKEQDKEIERLQNKNKKIQTILRTRARQDRKRKAKLRKLRLETTNQRLKLERLHSIIKEIRNKIENTTINCDGVAERLIDDIYEILDKEKQCLNFGQENEQ